MADEFDFVGEQERAKSTRKRGESVLPAGRFSPGVRDRVVSALQGLGQGITASQQVQGPISAALAGISGAATGPTPQQIATQRAMEELDATPIADVSPDTASFLEAAGIPDAASLPLSQVNKFMPLIESASQLQKFRASVDQRGEFSPQQAADFATFMGISKEQAAAFGRLPASIRPTALQAQAGQSRLAEQIAARQARMASLTRAQLIQVRDQLRKAVEDPIARFLNPEQFDENLQSLAQVNAQLGVTPAATPKAVAPEPTAIKMRAPSGKVGPVPNEKVKAAEKAGFVRVE